MVVITPRFVEAIRTSAGKPGKTLQDIVPVHDQGNIRDELKQVAAYPAASVFVAPSFEDNLHNTIMYTVACGTTTVAFLAVGIEDMIQKKLKAILQGYGTAMIYHAASSRQWIKRVRIGSTVKHVKML